MQSLMESIPPQKGSKEEYLPDNPFPVMCRAMKHMIAADEQGEADINIQKTEEIRSLSKTDSKLKLGALLW